MNIFLIRDNPQISAKAFMLIDPIRARKQLLECCQILACVDHILLGSTKMLKADGSPYKKAHPHHPITKRCAEHLEQYRLCFTVAAGLAAVLPDHACAKSYSAWYPNSPVPLVLTRGDPRLLVCRKGLDPVLVASREEYAKTMSAYLFSKIERDAEKASLKV